ncbi:MAG: Gfo/Idh/MocA family oxidoreductase [Leptolyngbyaceae cyanobacterium bins.59]|nr:Gfo/Idh/MocA family oxidoreductase [Leptolyngbyaceae cyanobacterium bins.59]
MRVAIVGLGIQGKKRKAIAGSDVTATVDPFSEAAQYKTIDQVPLADYDAALVCTPDQVKPEILTYLLSNGKHVLVEKPLLAADTEEIWKLERLARANQVTCYTAYNHRFEPHIARLKELIDSQMLGSIYMARLFYGNGTARDVRNSPWRDKGLGVLPDLGSHLLDMCLFLFGKPEGQFQPWSYNRFENQAFDHFFFGCAGKPLLELEMTLLSWRNSFSLDVYGEAGSAHINCLCKWGPSTLTVRKRVLPSGRPDEESQTLVCADPTWAREYQYFQDLCRTGATNLENDIWISSVLSELGQVVGEPLIA